MPWFTKNRYKYYTPERISPEIARERRLEALLEREQRFNTVPNFAATLSRVSEKNRSSVAKSIVNERLTDVHKAGLIAAALSQFKESDFASAAKREQYRRLRAAQQAEQKVKPSGSDRRHYNPTGKDFASTIYGTVAALSRRSSLAWVPTFKNPASVLPCIERIVRREVLFANQRAGVGYHTRKRRTWASGVPC